MTVKIYSECDRCGLTTEINALDKAERRRWGKEYVFCKLCARDYDNLLEVMEGRERDLLFNIWFRKGMEAGIIRNYKS